MNQPDPRELVEKFVEKYALRYVERDRRFLGLFHGLFIDVWEHEESNAWWFLLGGLAGVWVGFGFLKKLTLVTYR